MQNKHRQQESHLLKIIHNLSLYQSLYLKQVIKTCPDLPEAKALSLIKRLEKEGRLIFDKNEELLLYSKDVQPNAEIIFSFWILLDFLPEITYHTSGDFPVTLTFYTESDIYDVIYVSEGKEMLINQTLYTSMKSKRLVVVEHHEQISLLSFPDIAAFCTIGKDGKINYFKKQDDLETNS